MTPTVPIFSFLCLDILTLGLFVADLQRGTDLLCYVPRMRYFCNPTHLLIYISNHQSYPDPHHPSHLVFVVFHQEVL
jgi:hypothetical protein